MMPPDRKIVAESSAAAAAVPARIRPSRAKRKAMTDGGEDLEEALDPQVHHPPAPVLDDRQVRVLARRQARAVEDGDGRRRRSGTAPAAAAARRGCRSAGRQRPDHQEQPEEQARRAARSARRGPGRRTRSPGGRSRTQASSPSSCCGRSATRPASEPTTTTSSAPNRTLTPSRWPVGSLPLTSGPMNRPAASQAVAIQKMPSCMCQVRVTL